MNKEIKDSQGASPMFINFVFYFIAALLFVAYIYVYQYVPLEDTINNAVLNSITVFSALLAAGVSTAIYFHYDPEDLPRKIWLNLAIGSWFWLLGDALWGILAYYSETGEVSTPSIADSFWVIGIALFTFAFYYQYAIVFPTRKQTIFAITVCAWIFAMIAPAAVLLITGAFEWETYVNYYYPAAEILIGIAGIALVFVFQGGALVRPWIGMVVFSISDFFYAWAEQSGWYAWSSENNNMLTLAIDISYLIAYLMLGLGFLGHWILINYGLRRKR